MKNFNLKVITALTVLALSSAAMATNSNGDTTTNNNQTYNQPSATGNGYGGQGGAGGVGGQGGLGGQGGSGTGVGVGVGIGQGGNAVANGGNATGGSVLGSGNSSNSNKNDNTNTNLQNQVANSNSNSAVKNSGNSTSSSKSGVKNSGNSTSSSGGNSTSTNVSVAGDNIAAQERAPVSTAYAAGNAGTNGTCMGSSSGGFQLPGFAFSGGSTWNDDGCDARYDAVALSQVGMQTAAIARLCERPKIAAAMKQAGTACPSAVAPSAATSTKETAPVAEGKISADPIMTSSANMDDPFIRARFPVKDLPPSAK